MKILKAILLIALITITMSAFSQHLGVKAGINIANIEGDDIESGFDSRTGYHAGIYLTYVLSEKWTFEPGVLFSTKGVKFSLSESYDMGNNLVFSEEYEARIATQYLDIPFSFNYHPEPKLQLSLIPTISVLLDNKIEMIEKQCVGGSCTGSKTEDSSTEGIRSTDLGFGFGAGYSLTTNLRLLAGYTLGLLSIDDEDDSDVYHRVASFSVAFQF